MREGVRASEEVAWDVDDLEIKIYKVEQPSCLAAVEVLCLTEVCQVLVICKDLNGKEETVEVMPLEFQGTDDCKELPVVDVVVSFSGDE